MPLPDLDLICVQLFATPGEICITMPVGAELCVQFPSLVPPTPDELIKQLFAQLNSAMAPLTPIFNIIDAVVAVFECIKAISTLNPEEIINCIPNLAEKISALLKLVPQLSLPFLIVGFIDILILYLTGQRNQLVRQAAYLDRILAAATAATEPGNVALGAIVDCANSDVDVFFQFLNEQNAPLNRLIGFINLFLKLIGVKRCIPSLGGLASASIVPAIIAIDFLIDLLTTLRNLIPIPGFSFPLGDPNSDPDCE